MNKLLIMTMMLCFFVGALLLGCAPSAPVSAEIPKTPVPGTPKIGDSQICADGGVIAMVWEDLNGNGVQETGEPPIPNVCVWAQKAGTSLDATTIRNLCNSGSNKTGEDGKWNSELLFGTCGAPSDVAREMERQCNEYSVTVFSLPGYKATMTDSVKGCRAKFGLIRATP